MLDCLLATKIILFSSFFYVVQLLIRKKKVTAIFHVFISVLLLVKSWVYLLANKRNLKYCWWGVCVLEDWFFSSAIHGVFWPGNELIRLIRFLKTISYIDLISVMVLWYQNRERWCWWLLVVLMGNNLSIVWSMK